MRINLHLAWIPGEACRRRLSKILEVLKEDNRLVINALLNSGQFVPRTMREAGLRYAPPPMNGDQPAQEFYGILEMIDRGTFSCGDAAAYEAAVVEEMDRQPTYVDCVSQGPRDYHAIYFAGSGPVDPTHNWLRDYARDHGTTYVAPRSGSDRRGNHV